jgi:hypothetical protein
LEKRLLVVDFSLFACCVFASSLKSTSAITGIECDCVHCILYITETTIR